MSSANNTADGSEQQEYNFHREAHVKYFKSILNVMPSPYESIDTSRLTALYFSVTGLDILGELDSIDKREISEFLLSLQLVDISSSRSADSGVSVGDSSGFIGGNFANHSLCTLCRPEEFKTTICTSCSPLILHNHDMYHQGHIAMTYTALVTLLTIGDGLERVNKKAMIQGLKALQMPDGAFRATLEDSGEADVRFLFCACAISSVLNDWTSVDQERAVSYILRCITYEGGIAVLPDGEATGGSCYCAVASLVLMGRLGALSGQAIEDLARWCEARQVGGYQGRTNKDPDSCYSFWVGATLKLLGRFDCTDLPSTRTFLLRDCQQGQYSGGFSKLPDTYADVLHSFYSICWLSMADFPHLRTIDPSLGICSDRSPRNRDNPNP